MLDNIYFSFRNALTPDGHWLYNFSLLLVWQYSLICMFVRQNEEKGRRKTSQIKDPQHDKYFLQEGKNMLISLYWF